MDNFDSVRIDAHLLHLLHQLLRHFISDCHVNLLVLALA